MIIEKSIKSLLENEETSPTKVLPWRINQENNWNLYLSNSNFYNNINTLVYGVAGEGFYIKSSDINLNKFLYELIISPKSKLYFNIYEWIVRILVQNELYLLVTVNELGEVSLKVLPPEMVGTKSDDGIITTKEGRAVYYKMYSGEMIPDICVSSEPELKNKVPFKIPEQGGFFSRVGGFNKFIVCWKNLEGVTISKRGLVFPYSEVSNICISNEKIREIQFKFDNFLKYNFLNYIINLKDLLSGTPNNESEVSISYPPTMSLEKIKLMIDLGISEEKIAKELGLDYEEEAKIKIQERLKLEQNNNEKLLKEDLARIETVSILKETLNSLVSKFDNQTDTLKNILLKENSPLNVKMDPQSIDIGIKMDSPKEKTKRKKGTVVRDEAGQIAGFETIEFDMTEGGN